MNLCFLYIKVKVTFELFFFLHDSDERDPFEETSV